MTFRRSAAGVEGAGLMSVRASQWLAPSAFSLALIMFSILLFLASRSVEYRIEVFAGNYSTCALSADPDSLPGGVAAVWLTCRGFSAPKRVEWCLRAS
jgi:hypothetical protein